MLCVFCLQMSFICYDCVFVCATSLKCCVFFVYRCRYECMFACATSLKCCVFFVYRCRFLTRCGPRRACLSTVSQISRFPRGRPTWRVSSQCPCPWYIASASTHRHPRRYPPSPLGGSAGGRRLLWVDGCYLCRRVRSVEDMTSIVFKITL